MFGHSMERKRSPYRVLADVLRVVQDAKRDQTCIPFDDALEGRLAKRWKRLEAEMKRMVADQPS
jgi:hypothetical protein